MSPPGPSWPPSTTPGRPPLVIAERAFLAELGGGCTLPVGANAQWAPPGARTDSAIEEAEAGSALIALSAMMASGDGVVMLRYSSTGHDPEEVGRSVARYLLDDAGGADLGEWSPFPGPGAAVTVSLVGAGPGDPGLLTMRGAELIGQADVIVYDRLIARELLTLAPSGAELIDVGSEPGTADRQSEINELLIEHGRAGRRVVRLKGGDPFVFGRGGEEAEALRLAEVDYEVVPGVSSAFAAPAAAGIPVTHRGLATSVSVITARVGDASPSGGVDWPALGRTGGTLVILMGMSERSRISAGLLAGGRDPDTPVAVVHWGTTAEQRVVRATLGELPDIGLPAPATIVVGAVAALDVGPVSGDPTAP